MTDLRKIFTHDVIENLRSNKQNITPELLDTLRKDSNEGKKIALEILDIQKDLEQYYLDAFGNRISFNGIITLKRARTLLNLSEIHVHELKRCSNDIYYFMDNYCQIVTKSGTDFPELRGYQRKYLDAMQNNEAIVSSQSRQSGKSVVAGIYLLWLAMFKSDILIGIAANKNSSAKEILDKIKKIYMNLPIWMMSGLVSWNKTFVEFENGTKILTDSTNGDSFRGYTVNCLDENSEVEVYDKLDKKYKTMTLGEIYKSL